MGAPAPQAAAAAVWRCTAVRALPTASAWRVPGGVVGTPAGAAIEPLSKCICSQEEQGAEAAPVQNLSSTLLCGLTVRSKVHSGCMACEHLAGTFACRGCARMLQALLQFTDLPTISSVSRDQRRPLRRTAVAPAAGSTQMRTTCSSSAWSSP